MGWLVEQALTETGRVTNEDGWVVEGRFAAVLDGAGLGTSPRFAGFATDAAWLVAHCQTWLAANANGFADTPTCLAALEADLSAAFGPPDPNEPSGGPSACLSLAELIRVDGATAAIRVATIADTVALVPLPGGGIQLVTDDRVAPFEDRTFAAMRQAPRRGPDLAPTARAQIRANRAFVNVPDGYGVVSPVRPWVTYVRHDRLVMDATRPLVLMSDGVSRLFDTFDHMSVVDVYAACAAGKAAGLLAELRALERADPLAERVERFKIHDDATLLVIRSVA